MLCQLCISRFLSIFCLLTCRTLMHSMKPQKIITSMYSSSWQLQLKNLKHLSMYRYVMLWTQRWENSLTDCRFLTLTPPTLFWANFRCLSPKMTVGKLDLNGKPKSLLICWQKIPSNPIAGQNFVWRVYHLYVLRSEKLHISKRIFFQCNLSYSTS